MSASIAAAQRFTARQPCPICGGHAGLPSGRGVRCYGFLGSDGRYAHCSREELASGLDLEPGSDTYAHRLHGPCRCGVAHGDPDPEPAAIRRNGHAPFGLGPVVAEYPYPGADGVVRHRVTRHDPKDFRPWHCGPDGSWRIGEGGDKLPLYRLPALLAAEPDAWVLVVEGEKDADRLTALGLVATTNAGGAGKWRPEHAESLRGRQVAIIPDNDEPGERSAEHIARSLHGIAADVRVVRLPALPDKGDVSDWLDAGGTLDELRARIGEAPAWEPAASADDIPPHDRAWPAMAPLPAAVPIAPTMPLSLVPEPFRAWVADTAGLTRLPLEMAAVPPLVAAGAAVGRAVGLRPGQYDAFTVIPATWGALVARPGWMKSEAIKEAFRPLGRLVAAATEAYEAAEAESAATRERIEVEIDALKQAMRAAAKKGNDLASFEATLREKKAELKAATPTERRFVTHDPTVEKLGELLRDNPRGMLLLRDELAGWLRALDKAGREGDREFFLEAWNGTGSFTSDRIGRGTVHIPALTLALYGGIQPGKLASLVSSAVDGGFGDDGLLQRLQLTVWPDRLPEWRRPTRWPDATARARVDAIFETLAGLDGGMVGATDDTIPFLRLSASAQSVADDWRDALEHRLRSGQLDETPAFSAHLAKYRSLMPALALAFALIDHAAGAPDATRGEVGEASVRLAADWCGFLEAHARKLYAVELEAGASAAHALASKIKAGAVFDGQSVRELYRAQWAGLRTPERVLAGVNELEALGWVRVETSLTGGRPSQTIRLHPDLARSSEARRSATGHTAEHGDGGDD